MRQIAPGQSGLITLQAMIAGSTAVSFDARAVDAAASEVVASIEQSVALFGEKAQVLSQLAALASECADDGWDGGDAAWLDPLAICSAERLVRMLPENVPLPEVTPERDGSISLDWICAHDRLFCLSIGASDRMAIAWLDGTDSGNGVARFDGRAVPPVVLQGIQRTYERLGSM